MQLLLLRHAQTTANVDRALDTAAPGADLTDLGRRQVVELAHVLEDELIDAVYASPRLRALRTADALTGPRGLVAEVREGLVEIAAGDWEMSVEESDAAAYNAVMMAWIGGDETALVPGGETRDQVLARMDAVIEEIASRRLGTVAVVAHGALLRVWAGLRVPNIPLQMVCDHPLRNTGLIRVEGEPGAWSASVWDDQAVESDGPAGPVADPA